MAGNPLDLRIRAQYQLTEDDFASLTEQLLARFESHIEAAIDAGHTLMCVAIDGSDPLADLGRHIEQRAFETLADNLPPDTMSMEYGPYDGQSLFLIGVDLDQRSPVAVLRLMTGLAGLGPPTKSISDAVLHEGYRGADDPVLDLTQDGEEADDPIPRLLGGLAATGLSIDERSRRFVEDFHGIAAGSLIFDVATLARLPDVPTKEAGMLWTPLLVAGFLRVAALANVKHAVTFVTVDLLNALRRLCGGTWVDLGHFGEVEYVSGDPFPSQPSYIDLDGFRENLRKRRVSEERRPIPETRLESYANDPANDAAFAL